MKKMLLKVASLALMLAAGGLVVAQCPAPTNLVATVDAGNVNLTWTHATGMENNMIINENFDSYTTGTKVRAAAGSTNWTTWSNYSASEDAVISNEQSNSGSNSVKFVYGNDVVLKLGNKSTGHYRVSFDMYVPTGKNGYFNVLHAFAGTNSTWAMQCYLHLSNDGQNSTSTPNVGMIHAGSNSTASFACVYDQWMNFAIDVNIDLNVASFYVNGQFVATWQWNLDSFGENEASGNLDAMNFFPPEDAATSMYYIDNVKFEQYTGKYNVYRDNVVIASNVEGTEYTDNYLNPGTYQYNVQTACAGGTTSAMSSTATATVTNYQCDPVQNFAAVFNTFSSIDLSWNTPAGANPMNMAYNIYDGDNLITTIYGDTTYSYNIAATGSYTMSVEADYGNCLSQLATQTVQVSNIACGVPTCTVSDYTETAGYDAIIVRTSVIPSAVGYEVYQYDPVLGTSTLFHTLTGTYTGVYSAATPGDTYCFYIKALCLFGNDTIASQASETTCYTFPVICASPGTISLQVSGMNTVNLLWIESNNAVAYNVYRNDELIAQGVDDTYYTDTNLPIGFYWYSVSGVCIDGSESEQTLGPTVNITQDAVNENGAVSASVYPNPASDKLNVAAEGMKKIVVSTMLGQTVYSTEVEGNQAVISTSGFESGIYMVTIETENGSATRRVTVLR